MKCPYKIPVKRYEPGYNHRLIKLLEPYIQSPIAYYNYNRACHGVYTEDIAKGIYDYWKEKLDEMSI